MQQTSLAFPFLREVSDLPADANVLTPGSVEAVIVVSVQARQYFESQNPPGMEVGGQFRLSFDSAAFLYDRHGDRRPDSVVIPEVTSCLRKVNQIMKAIAEQGFKPCFGRKERGDEFTVGLWRRRTDPALPSKIKVTLGRSKNAQGWPVNLFAVEFDQQCERGLDEVTMAGITDVDAFREAF